MVPPLDDLRHPVLWRAVGAECLGTCILVLVGTGSCLDLGVPPSTVQIALSFGLTVAVLIWILGGSSGCHINPAVTLALVLTRKVSAVRGVVYMAAQCVGGMLGSAFLMAITPAQHRGTLGATALHPSLTPAQGFGVEFLLTFLLVLTVFAVLDEKRDQSKYAAFAIGLTVVVLVIVGLPYTGCSVNPARSLGPAVCTGLWHNHWVFWCGPMLGGYAAGLVYDHILAADASLRKARDYLLSANHTQEDSVEQKEEFLAVDEKETGI